MPQKMDLWHSWLALAMPGAALITIGLFTGFLVAKTTYMPISAFWTLPMALKRDLWYYELALATSGLVRVTASLAIAFPVINITYMPNFSLLGHFPGTGIPFHKGTLRTYFNLVRSDSPLYI